MGEARQKRSRSPDHNSGNWESVDLGDNKRKQKFLKLMGAEKKEHTGRLVIGDHKTHSACLSSEEEKRLTCNLERQYEEGLHSRMAGRHCHRGLGYHTEESVSAVASTLDCTKPTEEKQAEESKVKPPAPGSQSEKREVDEQISVKSKKKATYKSSFVRSSE
uniref:small acidic protein n=1 Tax=Myxine glutinosa TaxID=7769 RepID=UPI00358F2AEE